MSTPEENKALVRRFYDDFADLGGEPAARPALGTPCDQAMGGEDPVDRRGGAMNPATGEQRLDLVRAQARISAAQADDLVLDGWRGLVGWGMSRPPAVDQSLPTTRQ